MKSRLFEDLLAKGDSGTVAEWVRASALSHSEWMVPSSNPGEYINYFYSRVGDVKLSVTLIDGCQDGKRQLLKCGLVVFLTGQKCPYLHAIS